jgi:hypothetical protein
MIAIVAFVLLVLWKLPPWLVVILGAVVAAGAAHVVSDVCQVSRT